MASSIDTRKCARCHKNLPLIKFPIKQHGNPTGQDRGGTCELCVSVKQTSRKAKEEVKPHPKLSDDNLPVVKMDDFLAIITELHGAVQVEAKVDISGLANLHASMNRRVLADVVVQQISAVLQYRFT